MKPVEIQYESTGLIEKSYRKEKLSSNQLKVLEGILGEYFLYDNIEMISKYKDELVVCHKGFPNNVFNIEDDNFLDYYAIKINIKTKEYYLKFYTLNYHKFNLLKLPEKSVIAHQFGIGYYKKDSLENIIDIYFYHKNPIEVCEFFKNENLKAIKPNKNCIALFGLTYNNKTLEVIKLKRYIYPNDKCIKNFELL